MNYMEEYYSHYDEEGRLLSNNNMLSDSFRCLSEAKDLFEMV